MGWKAHATGHGLSSPWVCPVAQKKSRASLRRPAKKPLAFPLRAERVKIRAPRTAHRAPRTAHRAPRTAHRAPRTAHRTPRTAQFS
jgi:hypothetical protein